MKSERAEKLILFGCLATLLFLICDTFLFPVKINEEKVSRVIVHERTFRGATLYTYEVVTNKRSFEVYSDLYYKINKNDTILVKESFIAKSLLKVVVKRDLQEQEYDNGYITTFKGSVFVPLLLIAIISSLVFFGKFPWPPGRRNLIFLIAVLTVVQLYFYLTNSKQH